jgi:hypothetical protein
MHIDNNEKTILIRIIDKLESADVIAFLVILGVLVLNWRGVETMLSQAVSVVIGFYFGNKLTKHNNK